MSDFKNEILAIISKWWVWLLYIIIGMAGKFSFDWLHGKKLSWVQVFAGIGIALFVGFISSAVCINNGWQDKGMYVVPLATLLSEKLVMALFSLDYKKMAADFAGYWSDRLKK
jgi:hypothetical protein